MQNCLSILGFLDAVYSVLQKSIPYRVLLYVDLGVASTSDKGTITSPKKVIRGINDNYLTSTRLSSYVIALGFKYVF
ncbi:MAG: hypothetical protein ACRY3E_00125 [Candidatus Lariskella arthropodorum]